MDFLKLAWFRLQVRVGITTSEARALVAVAALLLAGVAIEQVRLRQADRIELVVERAHDPEEGSPMTQVNRAAISHDAPQASVRETGRTALDINHATADELDVLPGIGPALAARIVAFRERYGAFADVESLVMVRGIGPQTMVRLRQQVLVRSDSTSVSG